MQAIMKLD